jgi:hypothetical protein
MLIVKERKQKNNGVKGMNYLVVDTETTWKRKLMTAGALVFNENFEVIDKFYEMSVGAYRQGGYYKD